MPATRLLNKDLELVRPLLQVSKERLKATCKHFNQQWVEDPSNSRDDDAAQRARVRKAISLLDNIKPTELLASMKIFAQQRDQVELEVEKFRMRHAVLDEDVGVVKFPLNELLRLEEEAASRFIVQVISFISAKEDYKPRMPQMKRILEKLASKKAGAVGGALFVVEPYRLPNGMVEDYVFASADFSKAEPVKFETTEECRLGNWVIVPVTSYYKRIILRGMSKAEMVTIWTVTDKPMKKKLLSRCPMIMLQNLPAVITAEGSYSVIGFVPYLFDPDNGGSFKKTFSPKVDIVFPIEKRDF